MIRFKMTEKTEKLILSVETATRASSLAILRGAAICAKWRGDSVFSQSNDLLIEIKNILRVANVELNEIEELAAAVGPGNFTGLRVGLATIKGLAAALRISATGVLTLTAVAFETAGKNSVCSIMPAGRGEVFAQLFSEKITSKLKIGKISEVLPEFTNEQNLIVIASPEFHEEIYNFAEVSRFSGWQVAEPPENLAVCVGQIVLQRQYGISNQENLQIVYGREAEIGQKNA